MVRKAPRRVRIRNPLSGKHRAPQSAKLVGFFWVLLLITWLVGPVVSKAGLPSSLQAGFGCLADGLVPRLRHADRPLIADTADTADTADASVRVAKHARNSM